MFSFDVKGQKVASTFLEAVAEDGGCVFPLFNRQWYVLGTPFYGKLLRPCRTEWGGETESYCYGL